MSFLNTIHQKKAAIKTTLIMALLLLSFFWVGMTYLDPPPEMGIEVNFGTSDTGSGAIQPMTTEIPKTSSSENNSTPETSDAEAVQTQDSEESVVIPEKPKTNPKPNPKPDPKPKPKEMPKPDTSESDNAMNNIFGAPSNTNQNSTGHGDDASGGGDKGQIDGNPYANSFYGGGSGSGTGYGLNGRKKTSNSKFPPECNEEGIVVVQIEVDKNGKVTKAIPGVKGTTNSASCLLEPAKKTALSYKFNADAKAPTKQVGFVVINFSLGL